MRCLIDDDSSVIRKVTRRILERMKAEVDEAENGQEALEKISQQMPDAIIVDWHMPVMSGLDFLTNLRQSGATAQRKPFIIYTTTDNDPVDISRALAAGADDYVLKPYTSEAIEAKFYEAGIAN